MMNFCPVCGARIAAGSEECPQCGEKLRYVVQVSNGNTNAVSAKSAGVKKRNTLFNGTIPAEIQDFSGDSGISIKYNDSNDNATKNPQIFDDEMTIHGFEDSDDTELPLSDGKTVGVQETMADMSKYKIITQPYDKKTGFNAKELEEKLNMYAKLGYHIVANTMICQPGQDFFALMEKNSPQPEQQTNGIPSASDDKK